MFLLFRDIIFIGIAQEPGVIMYLGSLQRVDEILQAFEAVYHKLNDELCSDDIPELQYSRTAQQKKQVLNKLKKELRKDPNNAELLYRKACILGDLQHNKKTQIYFLKRAAEKGHPDAIYKLSLDIIYNMDIQKFLLRIGAINRLFDVVSVHDIDNARKRANYKSRYQKAYNLI